MLQQRIEEKKFGAAIGFTKSFGDQHLNLDITFLRRTFLAVNFQLGLLM
jgi:hypothetical protein